MAAKGKFQSRTRADALVITVPRSRNPKGTHPSAIWPQAFQWLGFPLGTVAVRLQVTGASTGDAGEDKQKSRGRQVPPARTRPISLYVFRARPHIFLDFVHGRVRDGLPKG